MKKATETTRRDFIKAASVAMVATTTAAALPRSDAYAITAERVAFMLESLDTPPVLRGLIQQACMSIDTAAAELCGPDTYDFKFDFPTTITPADVRQHLAERLRRVSDWRPETFEIISLVEPAEEGGGR